MEEVKPETQLTKSALKKLEAKKKKEEMKAKKAAEIAAKQAAEKAAREASEGAPQGENYQILPLNQSQNREGRIYEKIGDLNVSKANSMVWIRGRLHNSRVQGSNLCFPIIRERAFTIQTVVMSGGDSNIPKAMVRFASNITKESIVDVYGKLLSTEKPIESTTQKDVEIQVEKILVVSNASQLPVTLEDLSRPQALLKAQSAQVKEIEKKISELKEGDPQIEVLKQQREAAIKFVKVSRNTRLDHRVIDLRTQANQAIFQVQSSIGQFFREFLYSKDFVEIHSPKMIGAASEGGANVFKIEYFDRKAYLAQSPQFYKQMCIASDFNRVFEIAPVFRAENSHTHRHLTEFVGLDLEMAIVEHYHEVLDVLGDLFVYICENITNRCARQLEVISQQYPYEPFICKKVIVNFAEGVKMLREAGYVERNGEAMKEYDDLTTPGEKFLGSLIKQKYGSDFYILDQFPKAVRPFYTMPSPHSEHYSNSYDLFMRGEEICSGAQRIHDPILLEQRAKECGVDIKTIQPYIDAFKFGCPPHGGGGVGLERVAMLFLGLGNIRRTSLFPRDPTRLEP